MKGKDDSSAKHVEKSPEKKAPCEVTYGWEGKSYVGSSLHFHERGMLIHCRQPVPLNGKLSVSLMFPGFTNPIEMEAEVVWTNIHGPADTFRPRAMGVKFLNVEGRTERLLAELATQYDAYGSVYSCYYA